jgi:hypothetical protein
MVAIDIAEVLEHHQILEVFEDEIVDHDHQEIVVRICFLFF